MPWRSRSCARSWGWVPSIVKLTIAPFWSRSAGPRIAHRRNTAKHFVSAPQQAALVFGEFLGRKLAQEIDRGAQPDRLGDRWRARLELPGNLVPLGPLAVNADDHAAAECDRRHGLEQLTLAVEHANPRRPENLVAREGQEIHPQPAHVQAMMRQALSRVDKHAGTPRCAMATI